MKRTLALFIVVVGLVLVAGATTIQAAVVNPPVLVKNFSDWVVEHDGTGTPVTLTPNHTVVTIEANGSTGETWGGLYDDTPTPGSIGMKATINVSKVSAATGTVWIGILNSLGMVGTQRIQASIWYEANPFSQSRIRWRIKAKEGTNSTVLATGMFSDQWTAGYNLNTNITVYFQRVKNGVKFGIVGTPYTVTWTSTKAMTPMDFLPELFGYATSGANSIKAVIKNVYMLY